MLILDDGEQWTAITQPAHAWLAGQLARVWGTSEIAPPEPFEHVCLGIEQHDIAWAQYDLRPPLHADGRRAASFIEVPVNERLAVWHGAHALVLAQSPWAALLVSLHGMNIHRRYVSAAHLAEDEARAVNDYITAQLALQDQLIAVAGTTRAAAERQAELLFALDALSLSLCHGWPERELPPVDGVAVQYLPTAEREARLDPWPFTALRIEVSLGARTLRERFDDEPALHAALAAASYRQLTYTLRP